MEPKPSNIDTTEHSRSAHLQEILEAGPYAPVPSDATEGDVAAHRRNFGQAMQERFGLSEAGSPFDRLVRKEVSIYLGSNFDPRPLDEVRADVGAVLRAQIRR